MSFKVHSIYINLFCLIFILFVFNSCNNSDIEYSIETKVNPYKISPLTALLQINTESLCRASVKVLGETPIEQSFDTYSKNLNIPIVGLYPNTVNKVVVTLIFENEKVIDIPTPLKESDSDKSIRLRKEDEAEEKKKNAKKQLSLGRDFGKIGRAHV